MNDKKTLRRRNISWPKTVDETAERLSVERDMKVSEMLERLVLDEARHNRISPGTQSSLRALIEDIVKSLQAGGRAAKQVSEKIKGQRRREKKD